MPAEKIIQSIDNRLRRSYGETAKLVPAVGHPDALAIHDGALTQHSGSPIQLRHIFVDMTPAARTELAIASISSALGPSKPPPRAASKP
jgi:hypothetical protein